MAYGCRESGPRRLCRAGDFPLLELAGGRPFGSYRIGNALGGARDVDHQLACVRSPDPESLGKALIAYDHVVRNGAILCVLDDDRVDKRPRILLGCPDEVLVAIDGLLDGQARRVRPNLGGVGRFLAVVRAGCGDVYLLAAIARLGGDGGEAHGERVPIVEFVKRTAPTVALDARGGKVLNTRDLHRFRDEFKPFGEAVGEDGLATLGVFLALREGSGEADYLAYLVFVGVCGFVDGESRWDESRLDAVAWIDSFVIDVGVGAVRHGERAVGGVLGELGLELEAVRLALHAHGMLQVALREHELDGVSSLALVLVALACVDYLTRVLDQLSLAVGEIAAPVDVAHLAGKRVDNLEVGIGVAVSAGHATLMDGNLDGVGNHIADRDPFGLVGDLAHVELAVFDDVVVGVRCGEKLVRHGEKRLRRRVGPSPRRYEGKLDGGSLLRSGGVEIGSHQAKLVERVVRVCADGAVLVLDAAAWVFGRGDDALLLVDGQKVILVDDLRERDGASEAELLPHIQVDAGHMPFNLVRIVSSRIEELDAHLKISQAYRVEIQVLDERPCALVAAVHEYAGLEGVVICPLFVFVPAGCAVRHDGLHVIPVGKRDNGVDLVIAVACAGVAKREAAFRRRAVDARRESGIAGCGKLVIVSRVVLLDIRLAREPSHGFGVGKADAPVESFRRE